jgi:hypothetical protein
MPSTPLNPSETLHLTGFATFAELQAAKERATNKGFTVAWHGEASKVKEWQAHRWVHRSVRYKDYGDGVGLLISGPGVPTALASLRSALRVIGNPVFILVFNGSIK